MTWQKALRTWATIETQGRTRGAFKEGGSGLDYDYELVLHAHVKRFIGEAGRDDASLVAHWLCGIPGTWNRTPVQTRMSCLISIGHANLYYEADSRIPKLIVGDFAAKYKAFCEKVPIPEYNPVFDDARDVTVVEAPGYGVKAPDQESEFQHYMGTREQGYQVRPRKK